MRIFVHSRLSMIIGVLLFAWLVVIAAFQLIGPQETFVLQRTSIQHDTGCAYFVVLNPRPLTWPITTFVGDSESAQQASKLILLQELQPMGQPHTLHDEIRSKGDGRYSHWGNILYFSLPNCEDPREKGRNYSVLISTSLNNWAKISWFFAAILSGLWIKYRFSDHPIMPRALSFYRKVIELLLANLNLFELPYRAAFFLILILISVTGYLAWHWDSGRSVSLAVGGTYQISDAMGYWTCANVLLDGGTFGGGINSWTAEWCSRRATYPSLLASLIWIAQGNIHAVLMIQAAVVCIGIFVVMRRSSRHIGVAGILLGTALLLRYATSDLFSLTMTENAGLIFGCIGLALLLKSTENRSLVFVFAGVATLSIGLNARAGAFFVLPFLVLWSGFVAHSFNRKKLVWITATALAATAGFALQAALVTLAGGDPSSSHGSFSYVLYGLSVGGKGWAQVLVDHPELSNLHSDSLISKTIASLAWENIKFNPQLFLHGLIKNFSLFNSTGTYGFEKLGLWAVPAKLCWWLAWIPLLKNAKTPACMLISLASLGIIFSTPFLLGDGGARVFAATIAVDVFQISFGLHWIISALKYVSTRGEFHIFVQKYTETLTLAKTLFSIEMGLVLFTLSLIFLPYGLIRRQVIPSFQSDLVCNSNEYKVITYFGKKHSLLLSFVGENQVPQVMRGEILKDKFAQGIPALAWYRDKALEFKGRTLLTAYQLDKSDEYYPGPFFIMSDKYVSEKYFGKLVLLCLQMNNQEVIFGNPYLKINSIITLN